MLTITWIMLCSLLPIVGVFTLKIISYRMRLHKHRQILPLESKLGLVYLLVGLTVFFTGLFDTTIGKYLFEIYWISAGILSFALCVKEFKKNPSFSLIFFFIGYFHVILTPYIIIISYM